MIEFLAVTILTVVCLLAVVQMAVWVWGVQLSRSPWCTKGRAPWRRPAVRWMMVSLRTRSLLQDGLGARRADFQVDIAQDGDTVAVRARGTAPVISPVPPALRRRGPGHRLRRGRGPAVSGAERAGSSIVEFAILGTLVFGVLVQAVVLFGVLHRATLATSVAAREYGRAVVVG